MAVSNTELYRLITEQRKLMTNPTVPSTPLGFTAAINGSNIELSWTPATTSNVTGYTIYLNGSAIVTNFAGNIYIYSGTLTAGEYSFTLKALNSILEESAATSAAVVTVSIPSTPAPGAVLTGELVTVSWASCKTTLPIDHYKINTTSVTSSWFYSERVDWATKDFSVVAVDTAGNESAAGSVTVTLDAVSTISALTASGIAFGINLTLSYSVFTGFDKVEIWASTTNNRANAGMIGTTQTLKFAHTNLALVDNWFYWARIKDIYGNYGAWYPTSATGGVSGATSVNPADYLTILADSISEDELVAELNDRIDIIDTDTFLFAPDIIEPGVYNGLDGIYSGLSAVQATQAASIASVLNVAAQALSAGTQALADAATAITNAATAQGTADGKVTTYFSDSAPSAEGAGDLWFDTNDGNKLYRATAAGSAHWVAANDAQIATAIFNAATAQSTADGKIVTFYAATAPTATGAGDLWFDTDDGNKLYRATAPGSSYWVSVRDAGISTAIANLATLRAEVASLTSTSWSDTGDYILGKYVAYNGNVYVCLIAYTYAIDGTKTPGVDTDYWELTSALSTLVSAIDVRVDTLEGEITQKVSTTTFNALDNRVTVAESGITQNSNDILLRVVQTDFDVVEDRVGDAEAAIIVNANAITLKASQTDFNTLQGRVTNAEAGIVLSANEIELKVAQTTFDALESRVDSAESTISQNTSNITLRVTKAEFDNLFIPNFNAAAEYIVDNYVKQGGVTYVCILPIDFTPAPTPGVTAGWETYWEVSVFSDKFTSIINEIDVNTTGISILSESVTGPIAFLFDTDLTRIFETGVFVETAADVMGIDVRFALAEIDIAGAEANIVLNTLAIETLQNTTGGLTTQINQAIVDIDAAEAAIILRATKSELDGTLVAEYSAGTNYSIGDEVRYYTTVFDTTVWKIYRCKQGCVGVVPTNVDYWEEPGLLAGRLSAAETSILAGEAGTWASITNKVLTATYNTDKGTSDGRIGAAEETLSVHGGDLDDIKAQYTVKLNAGNHVAGFGLMLSESEPSEFAILADVFKIVNPAAEGVTPKIPFIVGLVNGVSAVGIDGNLFVDGSILARSIAAGSITADKYAQLRQSYCFTWDDSLDGSYPFIVPFRIVSEMTSIVSVKVSFRIMPFRAYSTGIAAGGGTVVTSSNGGAQTSSSGGGQALTSGAGGGQTTSADYQSVTGDVTGAGWTYTGNVYNNYQTQNTSQNDGAYHTHTYGLIGHTHLIGSHTHSLGGLYGHTHTVSNHTHTITVGGHTHTVDNHQHSITVGDHTHALSFGLYEETTTPTIHFHVDNGSGYGAASPGYTSHQADIDITGQVSGAGWKNIKFEADVRCRLSVIIECKVDITA